MYIVDTSPIIDSLKTVVIFLKTEVIIQNNY